MLQADTTVNFYILLYSLFPQTLPIVYWYPLSTHPENVVNLITCVATPVHTLDNLPWISYFKGKKNRVKWLHLQPAFTVQLAEMLI